VVVNVIPARTDSEQYSTAVYAAAHRLGMSVHNLDIFQLNDGLKIDMDLELPGELLLADAHQQSEQLSRIIREEVPVSSEISIHLEPRRDSPQPAVRYPPVLAEIEQAVRSLPGNETIHRIDAFLIEGGSVVTLYCTYSPTSSLDEVHGAMAGLERALRRLVPSIVRVQIDPELEEGAE